MLSLAYIAVIILVIALVLFISSKLLWLVFLLFCYRTISDFLPYEAFSNLGPDNHLLYFIIIVIITMAIYGLLLKFTMGLEWLRHMIIFGLALYCLFNYPLEDLLFFRDYFDSVDVFNWQWYKEQMSDFYKNPNTLPDMALALLNDIIQVFKSFFTGYMKN